MSSHTRLTRATAGTVAVVALVYPAVAWAWRSRSRYRSRHYHHGPRNYGSVSDLGPMFWGFMFVVVAVGLILYFRQKNRGP